MDELVIKGWRRLAVRRWGPPGGRPVIFLHGTPGSRLSSRFSATDLAEVGARLITYDRPGYGLSDPHPGRRVADAADDVRAIADALGLARFAVIGRSGGGPHALACGALLPDRVTRAAALVSLAPFDAQGLDWTAGMAALNRDQYRAARDNPQDLGRMLFPQVVAMRSDPEHLLRRLEAEAPDDDVAHLRDPRHRAELVESLHEAVSRSLDGWIADSLAFTRGWGFDPRWIRVPTLLWHSAGDVFSPVSHVHWLAAQIRTAKLMLSESGGHLEAATAQRAALAWLLDDGEPERAAG